ncbi:MAP3K12-binding inhibitory 1 isoform X2 [Pelobates cultripes]|uniref:MAP3K12-binding inhibitory 1 isoform X2 n=1 Tax=Pelobates cultripes TaxID=61616 RepID=A0AAD1TMP4_PELCU|nr:MAP3K12-binding inhibitory 1 isoform X2 [Pelobates cultripes]
MAKFERRESGGPQAWSELLKDILGEFERCVGKLTLNNDAVNFSINWENLQGRQDLKPSILCSALQQHITDLQPLVDKLKTLVDVESKKTAEVETIGELSLESSAMDHKSESLESSGKTMSKPSPININSSSLSDPSVVQIKAKKSEIDRRILAFIERKQAEINENNVREFCNVIDCNQENSCARTDAVFTPYPGFKSHIKVSRVVNTYGPQTRNDGTTGSSSRTNPLQHECSNQAVDERLQNIECHLRLKPGGPVPTDIYQRIKKLEDKILELEGISPEYFQSMDVPNKRKKSQTAQNYSLSELDQKINALRHSLLQKSKRGIGSEAHSIPS